MGWARVLLKAGLLVTVSALVWVQGWVWTLVKELDCL